MASMTAEQAMAEALEGTSALLDNDPRLPALVLERLAIAGWAVVPVVAAMLAAAQT